MNGIKKYRYFAVIVLAYGASHVLASTQGATRDSNGGDWVYADHDLAGTRYSDLKQITTNNVSKLIKACAYSFPDKEPSQTAPIVSAGRMYLTTAHYTVAVDGADCHVIWSSTWTPREHEPANTHRGAALADGKIIRGTDDGYLLALDAKNGHTLWAKQIADPKEGFFISMPPLVHGNLIYIGPAGAETAAHGWVGAFRMSDGEQVWRFNIVPDDGEPGADTWGPDSAARKHGGGNIWTPMSFDEKKNLLYVPGGNAAPDLYDDGRPGANLYTNSLIALDAATGHLVWYRQFVPHDVHDYDVSHVAPVFKTTISGSTRDVIASTGKDGLLRLLDRDSKDIIYSVPFTNRLNAEAPVTRTPLRVCPGTLGGQEWNGSAYYVKQNMLIVPATDWCAEFNKDATAPDPQKEHTHAFYFGGETKFDPWSAARGRLTAFDASTGHEKWRYDAAKPMVAGVTATAGDVIFAGELTGDLLALDAKTGQVLLRLDLGGPAGGGVVTYSARGVQNVAVVSGYVGVYNLVAPEIGGGNTTVTVFRLPENEMNAMRYVPFVGRLLIGLPFAMSGLSKLAAIGPTTEMIRAAGLPLPPLALAVSVVVELGGGLLLVAGFQTRIVAAVLALFSIATAVSFHSHFADQNQMIHFLKNVMMAGGLLQIVAFGAGALSIDNRSAKGGAPELARI